MVSALIPDAPERDSSLASVILVCTAAPFLYVVADGLLLRTVKVPCSINSVGFSVGKALSVVRQSLFTVA